MSDKKATEKLTLWSTQCVINRNLKKFADLYRKRNDGLVSYSNIVGDAVKTRTSLTSYQSQSPFLSLKNSQLASLIPYTRLYKESKPGELTEFHFDAFHDHSSMTEDMWNRGSGSGIKSVSIDMEGDSLATAERQFKVTIKFYFSSIEELFRDRRDGDRKYSYADIITPIRNFSATDDPCNTAGSNVLKAKEPSIRYLLKFGYSVPTGESLMDSNDTKIAIERAQRGIYLNLYKHSVDFNDNGTVSMTAEFHGYADRKFINIDVLQLGLARNDRLDESRNLRRKETGLCKNERKLQELNSPSKKPQAPCEPPPPKETEQEKEDRDDLKEEIEDRIEDQQELLAEMRTKAYNSFMTNLIKSGRIYRIDRQKVDREGNLTGPLELQRTRANQKAGVTYSSDYFFFGDLLEDTFALAKDFVQDKRFNFILGSLTYKQPRAAQAEEIPIAALPISMKLFRDWFKEHVIKKGERQTYNFMDFLRDVLNNLVKNTFIDKCYQENSDVKDVTMRPVMPKFAVDTFTSEDDLGGRQMTLRDVNEMKLKLNPIHNDNPYTNYYIYGVMPTMEKAPKTNGTEEEDAGVGIYHLISGREHGLVKNIKFTKEDQKFVTEARMMKQGFDSDYTVLRGLYNAEVTMFGNPLFRPGMMVYLSSTSFAARNARQIGLGGYYYVAKVYNSIEDGKFKTELKCKFHHSHNSGGGVNC